jgi:hypothetical protein
MVGSDEENLTGQNSFFTVKIKTNLYCLVLMLFTTACTETIRFNAIDAKTGQPLDGVSTCVTQYRTSVLHGCESLKPINLLRSNTNGLIMASKLEKVWLTEFVFSCDGYLNTYGNYQYNQGNFSYSNGTNAFFPHLPIESPLPFDDVFALQEPVTICQSSNGCFLIKLKPKN